MKEKVFSSLNLLLDTVEGANLLLEYYASFSKRVMGAHDFKTILTVFSEELKHIYMRQNIELILWQNNQRLVKFLYDDDKKRVYPAEEFSQKNTLYNYVLERL